MKTLEFIREIYEESKQNGYWPYVWMRTKRLFKIMVGVKVILLLLILVEGARAQSPTGPNRTDGGYSAVDGALTAGWAAALGGERWSTHAALARPGVQEAGLVKSANVRMAINFSLLGTIEAVEHFGPWQDRKSRWMFRTFKISAIALNVFLIVHNSQVKGAR